MRKRFALGLALAMALALCACDVIPEPDPNVGKYVCTSVVIEETELGADGEYLELKNGGKCSFYLYESPDEGTWVLEGENLSVTIPYADMDLNMTATLKDGVIKTTVPELSNATLTFQKEGEEAVEEETSEDAAAEEPAGDAAEEDSAEEEVPAE